MIVEFNQVRGIKPPINLHFTRGSHGQIIQCKLFKLNERIPINRYSKFILTGEGFEVRGKRTKDGLIEFVVPEEMTSMVGCNAAQINAYPARSRKIDVYEFNYITEDIDTNGKPFILNHNCYPCNYVLTRLVRFNTLLDEEMESLVDRVKKIMADIPPRNSQT